MKPQHQARYKTLSNRYKLISKSMRFFIAKSDNFEKNSKKINYEGLAKLKQIKKLMDLIEVEMNYITLHLYPINFKNDRLVKLPYVQEQIEIAKAKYNY